MELANDIMGKREKIMSFPSFYQALCQSVIKFACLSPLIESMPYFIQNSHISYASLSQHVPNG